MRTFLTISLLSLLTFPSYGQSPEIKRTWHWYFGWNAGLDFSNDTVVPDTNGAYNNWEACATMSDTAGNLLFYTDGEVVWNKNHQVMFNSLMGCWSSTQGALIVPKPGDDTLYYIFTTDCAENNLQSGLRYSVVDMAQNGGLGDVVQSNILLHTPVSEKLTGVAHSNGQDVWVITHRWDSDSFLVYQVSSTGVDIVPVISSIGTVHNGGTQLSNSNGFLKASPDGKKLVSVIYQDGILELFDFNNSTGTVSNVIVLPADTADYVNQNLDWGYVYYGASFSPGSSKLYITHLGASNPVMKPGKLYQYDLSSGNANDIIASKTVIVSTLGDWYTGIQLGADGKIYVSHEEKGIEIGLYLGIISNPDAPGLSCNYTEDGIFLDWQMPNGPLHVSRWSLPNFIESYFYDSTAVGLHDFNDLPLTVKVFPNPFSSAATVVLSGKFSNMTISIYDLIGKKVKHYAVPGEATRSHIIHRGNLPDGMYFLKVQTEHNTITKKILITN